MGEPSQICPISRGACVPGSSQIVSGLTTLDSHRLCQIFLCHCADAPSASVNCSSLSALPVLSHFLVIFIFIICGFLCCQCACASSATRSFQFNLSLGSRCDANK